MRWAGAFHFGDDWAAYRGPAGDNAAHAHAALQITLGVGCDIAITFGAGKTVSGRGLVTRAGASHRLERATDVIVILCDPTNPAASALKAFCRDEEVVELPKQIATRIPTTAPLANLLDDFASPSVSIDTRLANALDFLDREPGHRIQAAARDSGLSPSRLRSLAAAQLGIPLSRWQNWRMLRRAGLALKQGASLADAAQAGGFSDQAHFSRTMRAMVGLTPSSAREPLSTAGDLFKTG